MGTKLYKTIFPFVADNQFNIRTSEFALVEVTSLKEMTSSEFIKCLKKLVTKWVKGDPQGRVAYGSSNNRFNIGDFFLYEQQFGRWIGHQEFTKLGIVDLKVVYCEELLSEPIAFNTELVE
jgi:hypothetical protein